jgi:hypothetical protein
VSKHIVGTKIVRYLTAVKRDYGGHFDVIHHQVIAELHATKGWRVIRREAKVHTVKKLPTRRQWRAAFITVFRWMHKPSLRRTRYGVPVLSGIRP